jgi:hypothetical protein
MKKRDWWDEYKTNIRLIQVLGILSLCIIVLTFLLYLLQYMFWFTPLAFGWIAIALFAGSAFGYFKMQKYRYLLRKDYYIQLETIEKEIKTVLNKRNIKYKTKKVNVPPEFSRGKSIDTIYTINDKFLLKINSYYDLNTVYVKKSDKEFGQNKELISEMDSKLEPLYLEYIKQNN